MFDAVNDFAELDEPRDQCKALSGPLVGLWRLRVGDYRAVLDINGTQVTVIVVDVGHRSKIYG